MTETTEKSREELEAELERLRTNRAAVEKVAPAPSTREQSPAKPADYQRGKQDTIRVSLSGEEFEIDARAPKHIPTMFALRQNDFETVLRNLLGADGLDRALKALEDEDGYSDFDTLAEWVGDIYEKAGSKNS
ncbi:hypothetical protein Leucomu_05720 [Leucobacter muris]|uniref:Tail assembly chaperone n=1 Tax=Leucobacter muris TaxID=1935379 RepID=A0ABX5QEL6_9MICO|nr:hypothetical protein [Leucobacter muris]QAB17486.1 hypothetical protein Leucomu_05720 [Leucobacter muris]